jgi:fructose-1,6-bisphosphatase/inositol monophosphatase family enzyme
VTKPLLPGFDDPYAPVLGVIYAPLLDELFVGIHGQGSTRNGQKMAAPSVTDLGEAMISLSFGSTEETMRFMGNILKVLVSKTRKVRCLGSTALDLAHVAAGGLNALVQRGVRSWDFAAARIILEEAGGTFEAVQYASNLWEVIGCASGLYGQLRGIMRGIEISEPSRNLYKN